uniref:Uncharacterized protein n=1 Tax=Arundo donax TaxID=35708 RepID=A0A0A9ALA0_ARUDO
MLDSPVSYPNITWSVFGSLDWTTGPEGRDDHYG